MAEKGGRRTLVPQNVDVRRPAPMRRCGTHTHFRPDFAAGIRVEGMSVPLILKSKGGIGASQAPS